MKNYRAILAAAAIVAAVSSCSDKVKISGTVKGLPDSSVVVKEMDGNSVNVLDTVKTDKAGKYSYKLKIAEGQPKFVYLYNGEDKIASLLLSKGEKVTVVSDTLGSYTVEGSEESAKLQQVEICYSDFMNKFASTLAAGNQPEASKVYIDYYRSRVKYVMDNLKSLTSIPVLYQKINDNFPVFSQATDAILFKTVHDSLMTVYPDSKYVAALGSETEKRMDAMSLGLKMQNASEASFPDLELPSYSGAKVKLSAVKAKVVMVYFWTAADATQKLFNNDVLIPVYKEYHDKGFEIYSVSLDTDKLVWASAVKDQNLPWINVCDGLGASSTAASSYNVYRGLPVAFMIIDGKLSSETVQGEKDLRSVLSANL